MTDMPLLAKLSARTARVQSLSTATLFKAEPRPSRVRPLAVIGFAAVSLAVGFVIGAGPQSEAAVAAAGPELTHLLRAMAVLKLSFVGLGVWLAALRLRLPTGGGRAAAYVASVAAMAVAPGLIWGMSDVVSGAVLLHGGLVALALIAWTDRGTGPALSAWIARRRVRLAINTPPICR